GGDEHIGTQPTGNPLGHDRTLVRGYPKEERTATGLGDLPSQGIGVAVDDFPLCVRLTRVDDLITGRQDGDAGALVDQYLSFPNGSQDTQLSRPQKGLGGQDTFALPNILTTPPQVTAEARCPVNLYPRIAPIGVLDLYYRVGALW